MDTLNAFLRLSLGILALIGVCHLGNLYVNPAIAPMVNVAFCVVVTLISIASFIIDEDRIEALEHELTKMYAFKLGSKTPLRTKKPTIAPPVKIDGKVIEFVKKNEDE